MIIYTQLVAVSVINCSSGNGNMKLLGKTRQTTFVVSSYKATNKPDDFFVLSSGKSVLWLSFLRMVVTWYLLKDCKRGLFIYTYI